ncbi:WD40 repeat domain-containing protein [Tuwongella immobilis]|uniref:Uncharacterized protein n=1 Tax=Tuwongella immobilis TaxID=692036 RepID=A0A6C2YSP1_9BACT|nr:WD40 repeat domain-containing protein [Tuwongella immobilis]VIP04089.1 wd40 subgroup : WD40 repeat, subgroup OS=Ktedonobacter racemifer DSM 44963 GN=Krac_1460 PE=4 SV=1: IKI3: WD40: WD40: WD40 [Tuwongella immobilis]VTS05545.1 wd40 subgroup : WD40 repeat, subgroup OS=Ktedonobacter racemifer DSM 44963 GN=Krac_1460 PE=4 SV=1: IKI3: WD40: WD40: WD40 [Tuwongella immobilis]
MSRLSQWLQSSSADWQPLGSSELPDHVIALAWSPNGAYLAAATVSGPIAVLDGTTGREVERVRGHGFGTTAVDWLDERTWLSAGQDGQIHRWEIGNHSPVQSWDGGAKWVERLAVSRCRQFVASGAGRQLRIWNRHGELLQSADDHASTVADLAWRPHQTQVATAAFGGIRLYSPKLAQPVQSHAWKGSVLRIAWSPDGNYLATGDQDSTVHFWIAATGEDLQMWGYPTKVLQLSWDPTSRYLATGGSNQITIWDCSGRGPEGTKPLALRGHDPRSSIAALAFQHRGPKLVSGATDGRVILWQPNKGSQLLRQHVIGPAITQISWAGDDRRVAVGTEIGTVAIYRV